MNDNINQEFADRMKNSFYEPAKTEEEMTFEKEVEIFEKVISNYSELVKICKSDIKSAQLFSAMLEFSRLCN